MKHPKSKSLNIARLRAFLFAIIILLTTTTAHADKTSDLQADVQRKIANLIGQEIGEGLAEVIRLNDLNDTEHYLEGAYSVDFENRNGDQNTINSEFDLLKMSAIEVECEHINDPKFKKRTLYKTSYHSVYFEPERVRERLQRIADFNRYSARETSPYFISSDGLAKYLETPIQLSVNQYSNRQDQITEMQNQMLSPLFDPQAQDQTMTNVEKMQKKMIESGPDAIIQTTTFPQ